jgi:hypothetical protein
MKRVIIYLFIICFILSCKAQETKITANNVDVRIFSFMDTNVFAKKDYINIDGKLIFKQEKTIIPTPKTYTFYQNKDTMSIKCFCNYENNIFMDSIIFLKGNYEINIIQYLRKKQPQKIQKILKSDSSKKYRNLYFYRINLSDTANINFKKK